MKLNEALALRIKELCEQHDLTPHGLSIKSGVARIISSRCATNRLSLNLFMLFATGWIYRWKSSSPHRISKRGN